MSRVRMGMGLRARDKVSRVESTERRTNALSISVFCWQYRKYQILSVLTSTFIHTQLESVISSILLKKYLSKTIKKQFAEEVVK